MRKVILVLFSLFFIGCTETIHQQIRMGEIEKINNYIKEGKDLNKKSEITDFTRKSIWDHGLYKGDSLLRVAIRTNKYEIVKMLIDAGADYKERARGSNENFLAFAHYKRDPRIIKLLIDKGLDVNARDRLGHTPLLSHIQSNNAACVELLVKAGVRVNLKDWKGWPYFARAALNRNGVNVMKILLAAGAKIDAANKIGEQAIHWSGMKETLFLISKGAKVDAEDAFGRTPLHHRADDVNSKDYLNMINLLLDKGTNVNHRDKEGATPLHVAAAKGNVKGISLLLKRGANVNAQNINGNTPLHIAYFSKRPSSIKSVLILGGADQSIKNKNGRTPKEIIKLLRRRYYRR